MRRRGWIAVAVVVIVVAGLVAYASSTATISALPTPGGFETAVATRAKDFFVHRAAAGAPPPPVPLNAAAIAQGKALFGMDCATCHGQDGRHPAPIGQSMYPRVADLGSAQVQRLSRRELFWVVQNGIRFTGMPGFGRINSDQEIWELADYVHTLGHASPASRRSNGGQSRREGPR